MQPPKNTHQMVESVISADFSWSNFEGVNGAQVPRSAHGLLQDACMFERHNSTLTALNTNYLPFRSELLQSTQDFYPGFHGADFIQRRRGTS